MSLNVAEIKEFSGVNDCKILLLQNRARILSFFVREREKKRERASNMTERSLNRRYRKHSAP